MRSTTGRKLVEVKSAPRGSTGPTAVETDTGKTIEIDLGGGVVESGGKIIKGGVALDTMLEELELVQYLRVLFCTNIFRSRRYHR